MADRLNSEPIIFRGSASSELLLLVVWGALFWLPAAVVIAAFLSALAMATGIAALGIVATVYIGATVLQRLKRGRPDFYYQHRWIHWLDDWGLRRSALIRRSGQWDLGRTLRPMR